jgi:hypothetical protein
VINILKRRVLNVSVESSQKRRAIMGWQVFRKVITGCDGPAYDVCHPLFWDCTFSSSSLDVVINRVLVNASCKAVVEQCLEKLRADLVLSFADSVLSVVDDMDRIFEGVKNNKYSETFLTFPDKPIHLYTGSTRYKGVPEELAKAILDCLKWEITWERAAREGGHEWNIKHIKPDRWPHQFG